MGASRQSSVDGSHRAVTRVAGLMHAARVWIVFAAAALLIGSTGLRANDASPGDPVTIAVMYSSDRNRCFTPGVVTAIRHYTALRAREINANGGIAGRPVRLKYFDDFENADRARANAEAAAKMPLLVGIVGMSSSTRGKGMVDVIGSAGIPWISGMSRSDIFARHRSIYSMEPAVTDEIVAVSRFVRERKVRRPVFLGTKGDLYAASIAEALARAASTKDPSSTREPVSSDPPSADNTDAPPPMAFEAVWLERRPDFRLGEAALTEAVAAIRKADADMIFLALHSGPGAQLLRRLRREGLTPPAFVVLGRIGRIRGLTQPDGYDADMFELGREGVPDVLNERLQQRIWRNPDARWIFSDTRAASSPPGCEKFVAPTPITDVRGRTNRRAIARGLQHGDALMLLAEAAGSATTGDARQRATGEAKTIPAADIRTRIIAGLSAHRRGARIYRGWWQDWSFTPARAVAEQTLLVRQRADESDIALAPTQFVIRDAGARAVPVVYVNVDMVRIFRVDDNEKTFQAEFYLSARSGTAITLGDIEFTNAFRSQLSNAPVISARRIDGGDNDAFRLWRVTGKFTFDPDLGDYPFDRQRFSISFQPSKTTEPFFVQPPPARLRKAEFSSDGWKQLSAYVGSDHDIISVVGTRAGERVILPLDKFNYTWTMKRRATDYYLQVIVPLIVILAVTWLSVFIPSARLESVVAIQVTALLSSIALYLAIPKVDYDRATTSDMVFVVTYTAISIMLGLSILRANLTAGERTAAAASVKGFQLCLLPLLMIVMSDYILQQTTDGAVAPLEAVLSMISETVARRTL